MKTVITIAFALTSILSFSQTDIIEMRSRNASMKKYERSVKGDHLASNFGMLREPMVRNAVLDSVKCISDTVAIMYTSYYCADGFYESPVKFEYDEQGKSHRTYSDPRIGEKWEPGELKVYNHPLFQHRHSLDSIKKALDRDYYFNLPADSIKFIGFDNAQGQSNADSIQPVKHNRLKENSIGWELIFMLVTPILFAFAVYRFVLPKSSITT